MVHRSRGGGELQTVAPVPAARKSGSIRRRTAARGKSRAHAKRDRARSGPERPAGQQRARRTAPGRGALRHGRKAQSLPAQAPERGQKSSRRSFPLCEGRFRCKGLVVSG